MTKKNMPTKPDAEIGTEKVSGTGFPNLYELFETDENAVENGQWYHITPDISFKLRRYTSNASINSRRRLLTAVADKYKDDKTGEIPGDKMIELDKHLQIEQMTEAIVVDWKGVTDRTGAEVQFSTEAARKLLTDLPDLRALLSDFAGNIDNYRKAVLEKVEGN